MDSAFIGRQPIYTSNLEVCAYEVLFRNSHTNSGVFDDAEQATAQLILNLFIEIGLERVVGELPAFINMSESFILGDHAKSLPADRVVLEILEDVRPQPEIIAAITELKDLGYKLLRFVNSSALARSQPVNTIEAAVTMMGLNRLHSLASLELLAKVAQDKPPHLIVTALTRGRMCELLAKAAKRPTTASYFVAGLFSVLDAILDKPMPEALADLPLDSEIKDVLLTREGPMADILHCVVIYDQAQFDSVQLQGIDNATIREAYLDALTWAAEVSLTAARISD